MIVSAYGDMSNIRIAMNRGAFDFVTKPIDLADLELTIRKTLDEIAAVARNSPPARRGAAHAQQLGALFLAQRRRSCSPQDEPLGPVRRQDVAVLFADIVGFTALAETMTPEAVMETLRVFHGRMSREVFACGGTLEKFIGDAMLATFGVPHPSDRDAGNALRRRIDAGRARPLERRTRAGGGGDPHGHRRQLSGRSCSAISAASTAWPSP